MEWVNSFIWLISGVAIGWFAKQMVAAQILRSADKPVLPVVDLSVQEKNTARGELRPLSPLSAKAEDASLKEQYYDNDSLGG